MAKKKAMKKAVKDVKKSVRKAIKKDVPVEVVEQAVGRELDNASEAEDATIRNNAKRLSTAEPALKSGASRVASPENDADG